MSTGTPVLSVQNMPPQYVAEFNASRAYIANITEIDWRLSRDYGNYFIAGKKAGEQFSLTEIGPRKGRMDIGDNKRLEIPIMPAEVAADLIRDINGNAGGDDHTTSFLGVFICGKDGPTADELAVEQARLGEFYRFCVAQGDMEWQRSGQVIMIPDLWKRAAKTLNLDREWCAVIPSNIECPGCGEKIKAGVAVCKSCGAILNREKAIALGIVRMEPQPEVAASEPDQGSPRPRPTKDKSKS